MDTTQILKVMHNYVKTFHPDMTLEDTAKQKVAVILESSLEVVEFVIELEDHLGLDADELDMKQLAPKFETYNFTQLAEEIQKFLQNRNA